jgi:hypothetical protein
MPPPRPPIATRTVMRRLAGPAAALLAGLVAVGSLAAQGSASARQSASSHASFRPDLSSAERLDEWTLDGNGAWAIRDGLLLLEKAGKPAGSIRRPGALAILQTPPLGDASIEVELRSDAPEDVIRRDLLLVAGWQSPTRFYYVHLSAVRDAVHNGIFVVDAADRRRIDDLSDRPPLKDRAWHRARLVRSASTGRLEVFVDGEATPIMAATDRSIPSGRLGVGSFDDTGAFRGIRVQGVPTVP